MVEKGRRLTHNPLIAKLEHFTRLSAVEKKTVEEYCKATVRRVTSQTDIVEEGQAPEALYVMLDGWACRYKFLEDGRRQIVAFFLPGDLCDLNIFVLREMDHSIATLTPVRLAAIDRSSFEHLMLESPRLTQALLWENLVTTAIQPEWTVNLGQRNATERIAHLLCELFLRLKTVGLVDGERCPFPLTQAELADACGLSDVHVNRTLQQLRAGELITLAGKSLCIPKLEALMREGLFSANYLHLNRDGAHLDANEQ